MSFWAWFQNVWHETDELLCTETGRTVRMVEGMRRLKHGEPPHDLVQPAFPLRPTATGPPRRRRARRRVVLVEESIEEDDPDDTP